MNTNENEAIYIEMTELSKKLRVTDWRTAMKWCEEANIPIMLIGKKNVTYRFLAEAELDKRIIQLLKQQNPDQWEELYKYYKNNDHFNYVRAIQEGSAKIILETRVIPRSKFAKDFAKE